MSLCLEGFSKMHCVVDLINVSVKCILKLPGEISRIMHCDFCDAKSCQLHVSINFVHCFDRVVQRFI